MFVKINGDNVVDTDFEERCFSSSDERRQGGWFSVFAIYEDRGLNVAANMALAFKYWADQQGTIIQYVIDKQNKNYDTPWCYNSLYSKYADEINKYLMLI